MYNPPAFSEKDLTLQHQFIRERRFGLLVSCSPDGPKATGLPFYLEPSRAPLGVLCGHFSKANDHWKVLDNAQALVVFQGPDTYITPQWYPSKDEHGNVVPTWNYTMVQARGVARVIHDEEWLHRHVTQLTDFNESQSEDRPWQVSDAPPEYIKAQIRGIVGFEIEIREIDGKWKVSQNRPIPDRHGVVKGLEGSGQLAMAKLVRDKARR